MNSKASFDTLAVSVQLFNIVGPISSWEVHLFSYLACLMSLYDGNPPSDWGYRFAATESGSPYSYDLDVAIEQGIQFGFLEYRDHLISVSESGAQELDALSTLSELQKRMVYLEPACSSALAMPVGFVRAAVHRDATISSVARLETSRCLLEDMSLIQVQDQLDLVRSALGEPQREFLSPAITWIAYFSQEDMLDSVAQYVR